MQAMENALYAISNITTPAKGSRGEPRAFLASFTFKIYKEALNYTGPVKPSTSFY